MAEAGRERFENRESGTKARKADDNAEDVKEGRELYTENGGVVWCRVV